MTAPIVLVLSPGRAVASLPPPRSQPACRAKATVPHRCAVVPPCTKERPPAPRRAPAPWSPRRAQERRSEGGTWGPGPSRRVERSALHLRRPLAISARAQADNPLLHALIAHRMSDQQIGLAPRLTPVAGPQRDRHSGHRHGKTNRKRPPAVPRAHHRGARSGSWQTGAEIGVAATSGNVPTGLPQRIAHSTGGRALAIVNPLPINWSCAIARKAPISRWHGGTVNDFDTARFGI